MKEFSKGLEKILREMCDRVGVAFEDVDFDLPEWFMQYEWSREEEDDFIDWLTNKILEDKDIRNVFTDRKPSKRQARNFAEFFTFDYGWKLKREKKDE